MNGNTFYFDWEVSLIEWLQSTLGAFGENVGAFLANFGEEIILVAIIGFTYWCFDKKFGRYLGVSICIGITFNSMIKNIFLRRRPYFDHQNIKCVRAANTKADIMDISAQGFSFPSGHSVNSALTYIGFGAYLKKKSLIIAGVIITFLVGLSRLIVGVHYPTDVICGWILGLAIAFMTSFLLKRVKKTGILYLVVFLISCIGFFYCKSEDYFSSIGIMGGFFLGDLFAEKHACFENTKIWYKCILRLLCGFGIFLILNTVLKLPFSKEFLESGTMLSHLVRTGRYFICIFSIIGLYPALFIKFSRIF